MIEVGGGQDLFGVIDIMQMRNILVAESNSAITHSGEITQSACFNADWLGCAIFGKSHHFSRYTGNGFYSRPFSGIVYQSMFRVDAED